MSEIPFSRKEFDTLELNVSDLSKQLNSLYQRVLPLIEELEAKKTAVDKIVISCAGDTANKKVGIVMRMTTEEPYTAHKYVNSPGTSEDINLAAIYEAVDIFSKLFILNRKTVPIEIHSYSKQCVDKLNSFRSTTKYEYVKECITDLAVIRNKEIKVLFKEHSTDLDLALELARL